MATKGFAECSRSEPCRENSCAQTAELVVAACGSAALDERSMAEWELLNASAAGDADGIRSALAAGADVDGRGVRRLRTGSVFGMEGEWQPEEQRRTGMTALMRASLEGHDSTVQLLLQARASLVARDEDGMQAIHFAAQSGCVRVCEVLLEAGANPQIQDDAGVSAWDHLPSQCRETPDTELQWRNVFRNPAEQRGRNGVAPGQRACGREAPQQADAG